jgi:hypothetical protein
MRVVVVFFLTIVPFATRFPAGRVEMWRGGLG